MVGAVLLFLVIVNSFVTGWLFNQVRRMRKVVSRLAGVVKDVSRTQLEDDAEELL